MRLKYPQFISKMKLKGQKIAVEEPAAVPAEVPFEQPSIDPGPSRSANSNDAPCLPDDILVFVASRLVSDRRHGTLASWCAASKRHYHLLQPQLYRVFHLNPRSAHLLHQIVWHLYTTQPKLFPPERNPPYLKSPAHRRAMQAFTPVYQRSYLVQEIYVDRMPGAVAVQALRLLRDMRLHWCPFSNIRTIVFTETFWRFDNDRLDNAELGALLATIMQPTHICIQLPPSPKEDPGPVRPAGMGEWRMTDSYGEVFGDTVVWHMNSRPELSPPVETICIHGCGRACPPVIAAASAPPIDVYFPRLQRERFPPQSSDFGVSLTIPVRMIRLHYFAVMWARHTPRVSYRFHGFLSEGDIYNLRHLNRAAEMEPYDSSTFNPNGWFKQHWLRGFQQYWAKLSQEGMPRSKDSPNGWVECKQVLEEHFDFRPIPAADARCAYCHVQLQDSVKQVGYGAGA